MQTAQENYSSELLKYIIQNQHEINYIFSIINLP